MQRKTSRLSLKYRRYMQSRAWRAKKNRYWSSKYPKDCYVCGKARHPGMHLHHITYERLGKERLSDLVPVCQKCHEFIHSHHKAHPEISLRQATRECKGALKNRKTPKS